MKFIIETDEMVKIEPVSDPYMAGPAEPVVIERKPINTRRLKRLLSKAIDQQGFRLEKFDLKKSD